MESDSSVQQNVKRKRDRRAWTNEEDEAFLNILIEATNQGQRCDTGSFKPHTLKMAESKLEEKFPGCGIKVKPHIESAMKRLRTIHNIFYDMLIQSGFGWDDEKKMVTVDSDDVWNEYIKSHPNAKDYRNTPMPLLHKLSLAFGKERATGNGAVAPGDVIEELDKEDEVQNDDNDSDPLTQTASVNQSRSKTNDDYVQSQPKKKNRGANLVANSISELGKNLGKWLDVSSNRMVEVANRIGVDKDVFDDSRNVMTELKKMDLTDQERFDVAEKIVSMPHRLHVFWGCDEADRVAYVKSLI